MPIRPKHRFFYPIDWPQLSATIRFGRAGGACEGCGRPHGRTIYCLSDGRWWDVAAGAWRDGKGRTLPTLPTIEDLGAIRSTQVVLVTAHRDHDTAKNVKARVLGTMIYLFFVLRLKEFKHSSFDDFNAGSASPP